MKNDTPFYYSLPFLLALCVHIIVLAFLILEINRPVKSTPGGASASQSVIHATAVSQKTLDNYENQVQAQKAAVIRQQQLQQQMAREKIIQQQRQEILKQQQIRQLALQKLQAVQAARQKAIEAQQKAAAAQQKAIAEKEAAQKAAQQKVIKKAEERAQQQAEKKALQKALLKDMQKQLASDQSELNHNEKNSQKASTQHSTAATNSTSAAPPSQGEIDKYKALIIQAISSQWIVPPKLPQNISCELDVRIAPGGVVLHVSVTRSSGNPVLDNSAIAAVNKASPLPVPTAPGVFDQFRELHLTVKPDGSMTEG